MICSLMQALQPQEISTNRRRSGAASMQNSGLHKGGRSRKTVSQVKHSNCLSRAAQHRQVTAKVAFPIK